MTHSLPQGIRAGILASPQDFLHLVAGALDEPADLFFWSTGACWLQFTPRRSCRGNPMRLAGATATG